MMNSIKRLIVVSFALLAPVLGAFAAEQVTSPFPAVLKNAPRIENADKQKVQAGVDSLFDGLAKAKSDKVKPYRDLLCNEPKPQPGISAAFQAAYAEAIGASAPKAMADAKDLQIKLNIAIVVGKVAEFTGSSALDPAIKAVLQDKGSVAFVTWGLHGARYIMPDLHKTGNSKDLVALIVQNAIATPTGPNFDEAYEALKPVENPKIFPMLADGLLTLVEARVKLYQEYYPEDPYLELKPLGNLGSQTAWTAMSKELRQRWMQDTINFLTYSSARADELKGSTSRSQIVNAINNICKTFVVIAALNKDDKNWTSLSQIANKASTRTGLTVIPDSFEVAKEVADIAPAILKIPEFKSLVIPEPLPPLK